MPESGPEPNAALERGPFARWLGLAGLVLVLDQVTKALALAGLAYREPVALAPFFNLTLAYNTGAAFSFLSQAGGWQRWLFAAIAAGVAVVIVVWLHRLPRREAWTGTGLSLILGGAVGNLVDRLLYGYVVDFLDFHYGAWHWPAFNVADAGITVGVVLVLIGAWREGR